MIWIILQIYGFRNKPFLLRVLSSPFSRTGTHGNVAKAYLALVEELWVTGLAGLDLDGHLLAIRNVNTQVDVAEGAAADLADEPVLHAADELLRGRIHHAARHLLLALARSLRVGASAELCNSSLGSGPKARDATRLIKSIPQTERNAAAAGSEPRRRP
uniref:Transposase n=1 Tax=Steinernema glaseri TaxID=37863 RepID=A0A1I7Z6U4_9BILA